MSARRISRIPYQQGTIEAEDLEFKTIREDWNLYELEDGTLMKVKMVVNKISRGIDPQTGGMLRVPLSGEPYYNVRYNVTVVAEVSEKLMRAESSSDSK